MKISPAALRAGLSIALVGLLLPRGWCGGVPTPPVEPQPFLHAAGTLIDAMEMLGSPFRSRDRQAMREAARFPTAESVDRVQQILDRQSLFVVTITPEQRVKVVRGPADAELDEGGWRQYLVKVINEAGVTAPLAVGSPQAQPVYVAGSPEPAAQARPPEPSRPPLDSRWLDVQMAATPPLTAGLSGLGVEYRIIQLYSRDAGRRAATLAFDTGQGTQDLGFRNEANVLFRCRPAREVTLRLLDENGAPCVASLQITDRSGRVYPSPSKRVAPDFFFHPQVYRRDGETLRLPDGEYDIVFRRGPESLPESRHVVIDAGAKELRFQVRRWVDPARHGWWSGDHHIHAAGCAHYSAPSMGVHAADMARHCQGEDLKVGANLTWGPCFDYQKQFFTGAEDAVSRAPFLLRYDVEVSGFGSHKSGHLCLLKLREQMYPGGASIAHWPTLGLNTLKWAKRQGALCGTAHSGLGLQPRPSESAAPAGADELPNEAIPAFDGIGANEYIVDITHEVPGPDGQPVPAIDFLTTLDTPHTWELNIWYHTLNAGFRPRISGETDFPCLDSQRVGLGRSYVRLNGPLSYDAWCEGIRAGACYVSEGKSHLLNFRANDLPLGEQGSEVRLAAPGTIRLSAEVAARLEEKPSPDLRHWPAEQKPFWDLERARIDDTREVPVEVIVNGVAVARRNIVADGTLRPVSFDVAIERSAWVALRIRASSHTNPFFVLVQDRPIRERRSLEWCLRGVEQCWAQKEKHIAPSEHTEAVAAYDHARAVYRARIAESR